MKSMPEESFETQHLPEQQEKTDIHEPRLPQEQYISPEDYPTPRDLAMEVLNILQINPDKIVGRVYQFGKKGEVDKIKILGLEKEEDKYVRVVCEFTNPDGTETDSVSLQDFPELIYSKEAVRRHVEAEELKRRLEDLKREIKRFYDEVPIKEDVAERLPFIRDIDIDFEKGEINTDDLEALRRHIDKYSAVFEYFKEQCHKLAAEKQIFKSLLKESGIIEHFKSNPDILSVLTLFLYKRRLLESDFNEAGITWDNMIWRLYRDYPAPDRQLLVQTLQNALLKFEEKKESDDSADKLSAGEREVISKILLSLYDFYEKFEERRPVSQTGELLK